MSIATLKRKTQTKYNNMSVGQSQFAINGTHRNQGYVGQTSLSRSLPRTLMRGNVVRGHGGCCGTFTIGPIVQSGVTSQEDPNVVKKSSLGNAGMLSTRYKWINRPQPYATVKPDNNNNTNDQSDYLTRLAKKTISDIKKGNDPNNTECNNISYGDPLSGNCANCNTLHSKSAYSIVKPESDYLPISSGEYIINLHDDCVQNDVYIPTNVCKQPFAGFN